MSILLSVTSVEWFKLESAQGLYLCGTLVGLVRFRQRENLSVVAFRTARTSIHQSVSLMGFRLRMAEQTHS